MTPVQVALRCDMNNGHFSTKEGIGVIANLFQEFVEKYTFLFKKLFSFDCMLFMFTPLTTKQRFCNLTL